MSQISSLGYVGFAVQDLVKWKKLAVDVLGMQVGNSRDGQFLSLRMDELEQRIVLERGEADDLAYAGWMFDSEDSLVGYVQNQISSGLRIEECGPELAKLRCVEKVYFCMDPNGVRHEFAFGPNLAVEPFRSGVLRNGFVTGRLGLGHILLVAKNFAEMQDFIKHSLGLIVSDYAHQEIETPGGAVQVNAAFFHTITGRHHSLATAEMPLSKRLQHIMVQVEDMSDVGFAYDRCLAAGFPVAMGLGHHPNDDMFSFYINTPSGFLLEYGYGGRVIDDLNWDVKTYSQLSDWGHSVNI